MIPFAAKNLRASPASEVVERLVVESLPFRADREMRCYPATTKIIFFDCCAAGYTSDVGL